MISSGTLKVLVLTLLLSSTKQETSDNEVDDKASAFADVAQSLLQDQDLSSLVNNLIQSDGGKQIGSALMGAMGSGQVMEGLGSILSQAGGGSKAGFDPSVIMNVLSMMGSSGRNSRGDSGFDFGQLLSMAGTFFSQEGNAESLMDYLPILMNSFTAKAPKSNHADHDWFLPPVLERIHVFLEQFLNSETGHYIMNTLGLNKFMKMFADRNGNFSYDKFVELVENQSFRRHWLKIATSRMTTAISYISNPKLQKKYLTSAQQFINSFLKANGFPKSTLFDPTRPVETLTALANYVSREYMGYKIDAKQYVKPAVEYAKETFRLAQKRGFFQGANLDSTELSHKLADTINLEIIEPVARVNRAYRFAKKVPKCDRYVFCLVNEDEPNEQFSLPGLKKLLGKGTSIFASWFLSGHTGTPFWSLYNTITENHKCKKFYIEPCGEFHAEEIKVTTEYVHNEL